MKTALFDAWKKATSGLNGDDELQYPVADIRRHYVQAIAFHVLAEQDAKVNQYYEDDRKYRSSLPQDDPARYEPSPFPSVPEVEFKKFAGFSTDTFAMINNCRRDGLFEFLRDQERNPNELLIRNVCQFMMGQGEAKSSFSQIETAIRIISLTFDFDGDADFSDLHPRVAKGVYAAIQFLIDNPKLGQFAPICTEPVMLDPDCADRVKGYFDAYYPDTVAAVGFDPDQLKAYLETPAPSLALGVL